MSTSRKSDTKNKIMKIIIRDQGCTHEGFIQMELGLSIRTIQRHIKKLISMGKIERGWDGRSLNLTDSEIIEREVDACVRSHR